MNGGGILRKKNQREPPNMLVFGYSCKLFRDDEKALAIDRETNLIPAPFATKEKIDRYDVRATLLDVDIAHFEAPLGGYGNRLDYISSAEQEAELLAEEERYYSLYKNEVEEELYTEERKKREAAAGMSEVPFNYDTIGPKEANGEVIEDADDLPFIASPNLDLPADMEPPSTIKQNQIIEKTAKFIASQGLQMEILLKTKQANNTQFDFLNLNGKYNPYYKHIISLMKNNCYPSPIDNSEENSQASVDSNFNTQSTEAEAPRIIVPVIKYKPSADCSYTQLISKITKAPISAIEQQQKMLTAPIANGHVNNVVEVAKISTGLAGLLQSYNSDSETDHEEEPEELVYDGPEPSQELQHVIDKTAAYVAKNGCSFEDILRKKNDPRFSFLDYANEFYNYYTFKVRKSGGTVTVREPIPEPIPVVVEVKNAPPAPVSFSIKPKEEKAALKPAAVLVQPETSSDEDKWIPETAKKSNAVTVTASSPPKITNLVVESVFVNHVVEMDVVKEEKSAKEKLKDKLSNAAREKLGMLSKEKQLQLERKKKAMMFINQIKSELKISVTEAMTGEDNVINLTNNDDDSDVNSVFSIPLSPQRDKNSYESRSSRRKRSSSPKSRSRSRSRSSSRHKHKKSRHHSKKKHRKHSKSRSSSRSSRSSRKERI